jgi:pyridoxine 4-dehydrogenase
MKMPVKTYRHLRQRLRERPVKASDITMPEVGASPFEDGTSYRLAGRSVSRVGYGAMQLAGPGDVPAPSPEQATKVLRRARELGVNHIDTAHFYGLGRANEMIQAALHPYAADLLLVSKVGVVGNDSGRRAAQHPEDLRAQVEANLSSLAAEQLGVVNLRRTDRPPGSLAGPDQQVDLDSQLAELISLRDEGKIGGIGLSHVLIDQVRQALPAGIVCVQNAYSMLDRSDEPIFELCLENGVAWVPYFPLGSAFAGRLKVTEAPAVIDAATELEVTPAQVGLAWLLHHGPNVLLIPGTASVGHLEENVGAANVALDARTLATLDGLAKTGQ